MDSIGLIAAMVAALLLGAMSPGPSFVVVARTSIAVSRRDGVAAAIGMGIGGVVFGGLALFGLRTLLTEVTWIYFILKAAGGAYLIYLGIRLWRLADRPIEMTEASARLPARLERSFGIGLATQLSNPKTAIVYASIFAALLPEHPPAFIWLALPPLVFLVEAGWYTTVALVFSSARPRAVYLRSKGRIDRLTGAVLGGLGAKLIADTARPS